MSYILEALKKSEQQRGAGASPTVQTIHSSALQYSQQKKPLWPYILAVVITLNVIALIVFFAPGTSKPPAEINAVTTPVVADTAPQAAMTQTDTIPPAATAPPMEAPAPVTTTPVTNHSAVEPPADKPSRQQTQATTSTAQRPLPATNNTVTGYDRAQNDFVRIVDIHDLPLEIQTRIPDMVFSAHVYSSNPQQRSVVINGNFMEQGDYLTSQLRLEQITRDGVVFDFDGTRFRSSVLSDWKIR